ncbi:flagellin lysine-N-methylase [Brevibacillus fluminis]|uniref:flagellin lysine-N-methylase n=1 Tax=Brevibacillus fluminis TaxID=511487 RepID=UPI003F8BFC6E
MTKSFYNSANYMKDFQCLGDTCEDTCCQGWYVDIDKKTFVKYKRIPDKKLKRRIQMHIRRNKMKTSFSDYATIKFPKGEFCPFLNTEKLCSIQLELGPTHLSRTCATYPRQYNMVFDRHELTGACSCPEVARLVLLNRDGIRITEERVQLPADPVIDNLVDDPDLEAVFDMLRHFVLDVLQHRAISIEDRLLVLGSFFADFSYEKLSRVKKRIKDYRDMLDRGAVAELVADLPIEPDVQFAYFRQTIETHVQSYVSNQRYLELVDLCRQGWETHDRFTTAYHSYYQPFMTEHDYMMENYLVNHVLAQLFPVAGIEKGKEPFDEWMLMVLHYTTAKYHLVALSASQQGLTPDLVVRMMQSYARTYEHDISYFSNEIKHLHEDGLTTLPFMSILLKNE